MDTRKERTRKLSERARFWIDDLEVHPDRLIVVRDGAEIALEPRMMEILIELAERAGKTVSKDELLEELWSGKSQQAVYGDNPLSKSMSYLRKFIGDDPKKPRYIETISKVGYRLIAPVRFPDSYRRAHSRHGAWTHGSPYVGLTPFDERHADVFQGRSRTMAALLAAMREQINSKRRLILIVGSSGCGKTSLLHAAAIPALKRAHPGNGLHALSVATCDLAVAHAGDFTAVLASSLMSWKLDGNPVFPPESLDAMKAALNEDPGAVAAAVTEAFSRLDRRVAANPYSHLLLAIDHSEALMASKRGSDSGIQAFSRALRMLCETQHVFTIMVTRWDYYHRLADALPELAEYRSGFGHFEISTPNAGEIAKIIRRPAEMANLEFEEHPTTQIALDDLLRDVAMAQPDALPLLQHTLQALYERRDGNNTLTFAAYDEIGGLEGAIARHADTVFSKLTEEARSSIDQVMTALVSIQPDGESFSALKTETDGLPEPAAEFVQAFVDARIFVMGLTNGRPCFGVAHEAFFRQWPIAADWIHTNQRLLRAKENLRTSAERWHGEGRKKDLLINQAVFISEAIEVEKKFQSSLKEAEKDFIRQCKQSFFFRKRLWQGLTLSLGALSILSIALWMNAKSAKDVADKNRGYTQSYADYILEDLTTSLRSRGDHNLLVETNQRILKHFENRPYTDLSDEEKATLSLAMSIKGENAAVTNDRDTMSASFERSKLILDSISKGFRSRKYYLSKAINAKNMRLYFAMHGDADKVSSYVAEWARSSENLYSFDKGYTSSENYTSALEALAEDHATKDQLDDALSAIKKSQSIRFQLYDKTDVDGPLMLQHSMHNRLAASILEYRGELEKSRSIKVRSIASLKNMILNRPRDESNIAWIGIASIGLNDLSSINMATGRPAESIANAKESIEIIDAELDRRKDKQYVNAYLLDMRGVAYARLGEAQEMLGMIPESKASFANALANYSGGTSVPRNDSVKDEIHILNATADSPDTKRAIQRLVDSYDKNPGNILLSAFTAKMLIRYGNMLYKNGDTESAKPYWAQAKSVLSRWKGTKNHLVIALWIEASILNGDEMPISHINALAKIGYRSPRMNYLVGMVKEEDRPLLRLIAFT